MSNPCCYEEKIELDLLEAKAEIVRLRKALEDIIEVEGGDNDPMCYDPYDPAEMARRALEGSSDE